MKAIDTAQARLRTYTIANFIAVQLAWWACVLGGASDFSIAGTALVVIGIVRHLGFARHPRREAELIVYATAIGAVFDTALIQLGLIRFHHGEFIAGFAPHWMLALWASFATTFNLSLAWLKRHLPLAALLGAIAGPFAYWSGARLGAADLLEPKTTLLAIAGGWAMAMPLLMKLARHRDGFADTAVAATAATGAGS